MSRNAVFTLTQWEARVSEVFSIIRLSQCTHAVSLEIIDRRIYAELNSRTKTRSRYPAYMIGYVNGLISAHRADIWQNYVEFCYDVNGVLYTTAKHETGKPKTEEWHARGEGHILARSPGAHYWTGTDKRYSGDYCHAFANSK